MKISQILPCYKKKCSSQGHSISTVEDKIKRKRREVKIAPPVNSLEFRICFAFIFHVYIVTLSNILTVK